MTSGSVRNSTNVRTKKAPPALRVAGASLRLLGAVWPQAAAVVAERLFLSPPRFPAAARERTAFAAARPSTIESPEGRLRLWRFDDRPVDVLLLHGWGGRASQMAAFAEPLRAAGLGVAALDGPAHGASAGRIATVPGFARALLAAHAVLGFRAVIAHSMGGAATGVAVGRHGLALDAAVLIGSPATPSRFLRDFADAVALPQAIEAALLRRLAVRTGLTLADLDIAALGPALRGPALVVHDRADREVPFGDAEAIARAWAGSELLATAGLGHRRILRDAHIVAAACRFVAQALGRPLQGCAASGCLDFASAPGGYCERCALDAFLFDPRTRWPAAA